MPFDPAFAQFGDLVADVADDTDRFIYLPEDELPLWFRPASDDWFEPDDINWGQMRLTHRLVPVDENEAG